MARSCWNNTIGAAFGAAALASAAAPAGAQSLFDGRSLTCVSEGSEFTAGEIIYRYDFVDDANVVWSVSRGEMTCDGGDRVGNFKRGAFTPYRFSCARSAQSGDVKVDYSINAVGEMKVTARGNVIRATDRRRSTWRRDQSSWDFKAGFDIRISCDQNRCEGRVIATEERLGETTDALKCELVDDRAS